MRSACCRTSDHLVVPVSTTRATRRTCRFCWWRMRRSVVSSNSNPASSAALKSSPLLSASQPLACAVWTVCPDNARASPFGVPWSKRMSTGRDGVRAKALSHEIQYGHHLLARHVELLDDLVHAEILKVFDDSGHGQTSAFEHPGAAYLARDALDGRALGPVKGCHSDSLLQITAKRYSSHPGSGCVTKPVDLPQPSPH